MMTTDSFTEIFEPQHDAAPPLDELVRAAMRWHFSADTGSPYWLRRAEQLDFNPLQDINTFADLRMFGPDPVDWATVAADALIPAGCADRSATFGVYESGGTTGSPKRIIDASSRLGNVRWIDQHLDGHRFPAGSGHWLHIGPTGPHIMGKNIRNLAELRGALCFAIDLDPRWVRRCIAEGRADGVRRYMDHILDQVRDILATQDIRMMSTTPPMLEAIVARPDVYELVQQKVRGILWGGTSIDAETLRLCEQEAYPDAVIVGAYGNTMMGVAPQRPRLPDDPASCVFRPYYPYSVVEVVAADDPGEDEVPYDTQGRVRITALTRELFVPPTLERDLAVRRAPVDKSPGNELSDVRPRQLAGPDRIIEGVY